jgi:hypothetical protein
MMACAGSQFKNTRTIFLYSFFDITRYTDDGFYTMGPEEFFRPGAHASGNNDISTEAFQPLGQNARCMAGIGMLRAIKDVPLFIDRKKGVVRRMAEMGAHSAVLDGYGYFHDSHLQNFLSRNFRGLFRVVRSENGESDVSPSPTPGKEKVKEEIDSLFHPGG